MEAPPGTLILVLGAGEEMREGVRDPERTLGRSEIRCPAAEGGGFAYTVEDPVGGLGNCRASGWSESARVFERPSSGCNRLFPAI